MGRRAKNIYELGDGRQVSYAPKVRGGLFRVQFNHPTVTGKYVEVATGVEVPKGWHYGKSPPPEWFSEAGKAMKSAYSQAAFNGSDDKDNKATWKEAETFILERITRDASSRTYRSALAVVQSAFPGKSGPSELTPSDAEEFSRKYEVGGYQRTKGGGGKVRPRSAQTIRTTLNNLSVLWARLKNLHLVAENIWANVERPKVPKKLPRIPKEESIGKLFTWLDKRFPGPDGNGWKLLKTFIRVKMLAGCRLNDLCQVKTCQFDTNAGTLLITADQDKTHQERLITLPDSLTIALNQLKGPCYLWEQYVGDSAVFRPGKRRAKEFTPSVLYHAIQSIFREFGEANPEHKVKTHDLRKRAITITVIATGGDMNAAAQAIPVTPDTARKHYLAAQQAYDAAEIQRRTAGRLLGEWGVDAAKPDELTES